MELLGIDIGSKTLKVVLIDPDKPEPIYDSYHRHRSQVQQRLQAELHNIVWRLGDRAVSVVVTGSAGMRVAELFDIPFVQEVVALKAAVGAFVPQADAVLEMGGEDTKLVYLTGTPEQRMNTICAGGTGAFLEMMSGLLGIKVTQLSKLAMGHQRTYPIASRCAVFAKSDVRPLLNAGVSKSDIAMSVMEAVCTQAVAGLSAGRPLQGTVVLLGGPFEHMPALREAFRHVTGFDPDRIVVPGDAHLFVAKGALLASEGSAPLQLSEFERMVTQTPFESAEGIGHLPPLFESQEDYKAFRRRHDGNTLPRRGYNTATKTMFVGVDAGSTTVKAALIDETGALVDYGYERSRGDVTKTLSEMLANFRSQIAQQWDNGRTIGRSCIVGYGEDYCKAAFGIDEGQVETVAHLRAAMELQPQVDFLLDIGGQDVKCFYIEDGQITDVVLNEACSSGCGSLFDSVAHGMRRTKERFSEEALFAKNPVDLGTRCSTFMDSRVKHAQKEGTPVEDIAAGVCYATARNALFKVVRQPDFSKVGKHVVVQGGAFANDALLRAFELETGADVVRPDLSQLMGAWGAALLARDSWLELKEQGGGKDAPASTLLDLEELEHLDVERESMTCGQCTNRCTLTVSRFGPEGPSQRVFAIGNRCEKGLATLGAKDAPATVPPNMFKVKNALIASFDRAGASCDKRADTVVGIPKSLALYESYPFWRALFDELGFEVVAHGKSDDELFRAGMASIPAEGMCYPAKLAFGQCAQLAQAGAHVLFVPNLNTAFARDGLAGIPVSSAESTCPIVENLGDLVEANRIGSAYEHCAVAAPDLRCARRLEDLDEPIAAALAPLRPPIGREEMDRAISHAHERYRAYLGKLEKHNAEVLEAVRAGDMPGALLIGHGYHADAGINHGIDELLGKLGYAVVERMSYLEPTEETQDAPIPRNDDALAAPWTENAYAFRQAALSHGISELQVIVLRSFGCGIDALVADALHDELKRQGRLYAELKIDQIVDLAAVRIRLRSLAYAQAQRARTR